MLQSGVGDPQVFLRGTKAARLWWGEWEREEMGQTDIRKENTDSKLEKGKEPQFTYHSISLCLLDI